MGYGMFFPAHQVVDSPAMGYKELWGIWGMGEEYCKYRFYHALKCSEVKGLFVLYW
jgi:hypothetical protein